MTAPFTLRLDERVVGALDELAAKTDQSRDRLVERAITDFIALQAWQVAKIEAGIAVISRTRKISRCSVRNSLCRREDSLDPSCPTRSRKHCGICRERYPAAAASLLGRILDRVETLAVYPELGRAGRVAGTRELVIADTPFIVPYRVKDDVEVLAVFHGSRLWPESFR